MCEVGREVEREKGFVKNSIYFYNFFYFFVFLFVVVFDSLPTFAY